MSHDLTKVLMGNVKTSSKVISEVSGSPVTYKAGLAIRQKSDDTPSVILADGRWLGVSLGKGLSDAVNKTAIARDGLGVPVLLDLSPAKLVITITSYANLIATGDDTLQFEHAALVLDSTLTFKASASTEGEVAAVTSNTQTATNLKNKINAHSVLGTIFYATSSGAIVTVIVKDRTLVGTDFDVTYVDNSNVGLTLDDTTFTGGDSAAPDYVAIGSKAYFSNVSGKADYANANATISDAVYVSGVKTAIQEDGTEAYCAYVDMQGGL